MPKHNREEEEEKNPLIRQYYALESCGLNLDRLKQEIRRGGVYYELPKPDCLHPLQRAIREDQTEAAMLLMCKHNFDLTGEDGLSVFQEIVKHGNLELLARASFFVEHTRRTFYLLACDYALLYNRLDVLEWLGKNCDLETRRVGCSGKYLAAAVFNNYVDVVRLFFCLSPPPPAKFLLRDLVPFVHSKEMAALLHKHGVDQELALLRAFFVGFDANIFAFLENGAAIKDFSSPKIQGYCGSFWCGAFVQKHPQMTRDIFSLSFWGKKGGRPNTSGSRPAPDIASLDDFLNKATDTDACWIQITHWMASGNFKSWSSEQYDAIPKSMTHNCVPWALQLIVCQETGLVPCLMDIIDSYLFAVAWPLSASRMHRVVRGFLCGEDAD